MYMQLEHEVDNPNAVGSVQNQLWNVVRQIPNAGEVEVA